MTETYTPLTDAELYRVESVCPGTLGERAAAEIRALRASEARLLAALKPIVEKVQRGGFEIPTIPQMERVAAAYRAAEGRAEG